MSKITTIIILNIIKIHEKNLIIFHCSWYHHYSTITAELI